MRGTFVSGLTEGDIWRLDIFEGAEYARRKVRLRVLSDAGEEFEVAETYVWVAGREKLEGGEWDFEAFRREKMGAWVGGGKEADGGFAGVWDLILKTLSCDGMEDVVLRARRELGLTW